MTSESDNGWPLTRGSGKRSEPISRKALNQQFNRFAARPAEFQGTLLLPGLIRRLELLKPNQLHRKARLRRPDLARSVQSQTPDQIVRAAVVIPPVMAAQDVCVGGHGHR